MFDSMGFLVMEGWHQSLLNTSMQRFKASIECSQDLYFQHKITSKYLDRNECLGWNNFSVYFGGVFFFFFWNQIWSGGKTETWLFPMKSWRLGNEAALAEERTTATGKQNRVVRGARGEEAGKPRSQFEPCDGDSRRRCRWNFQRIFDEVQSCFNQIQMILMILDWSSWFFYPP